MEMLQKNIKSKEFSRIKGILRKYVKRKDGDMFRIRRDSPNDWHWVALTRDWYIDDAYAFTVLDFELCKNILALMQDSKKEDFGSSESKTIVTKDDIMIYIGHELGIESDLDSVPPAKRNKISDKRDLQSRKT